MSLSFRGLPRASVIAVLPIAFVSCNGAEKTPAVPTASPTPVAQPTPAPTPTPAPAPTADPQSGLAPGPVMQVKVYLKTVEATRGSSVFRDPAKDAQGRFILYPGEFVVVDVTQRNSAGQICRWRQDPRYSWDNFDGMMDVKSSSEPFFFKFVVARTGAAEVSAIIDGIASNDVQMVAVVRR
jgi:hypothetical protein